MPRRLLLTALAAVALTLVACAQSPTQSSADPVAPSDRAGGPLTVIASTSIIADVVGQVGGDQVSVSTLVPIGADTHSFEPTPQDIARVSAARLIFANGAGYEGFLDRLLTSAGGEAKLVELSAGITLRELNEGEAHAEGGLDPHTWTDPNNVKYWTEAITTALTTADPANAAVYRANAERYNAALSELDSWISAQFAPIPAERRLIVTDHAVFGYMADRYDLRQVGTLLPGFSSAAEPSAQELAALQDAIRTLGVRAIFVSDLASQSLAERLSEDTGTQLVTVLTESLTPPDGPGATYIDYMRSNVRTMAEALR